MVFDQHLANEKQILIFMMEHGAFQNDENFTTPEQITLETSKINAVENINSFFETLPFIQNKNINDMMIRKLSGKNEANVAPNCPKCRSARFYLAIQRRSRDEAINNEIHCPGCGLVQQC